MNYRKENFYVITGGPGVGKTSILEELLKSGYEVVPEIAREIIRDQMKVNGEGLPWKNKELYTDLMLKASVDSYVEAFNNSSTSILFFDRGILDTLCYAQMVGIRISDEMNEMVNSYLYNKRVFILPPWLEIYQTDDERKQTWEEAVFTYEKMKETYTKYGYEIIEVPKGSVENRRDFILENL